MSSSHQAEIVARNTLRGPSVTREATDPLDLCPERLRPRYRARAQRAMAGRYRDAVGLKCIDCCGWQHAEAKRCEITACPLYALNRRIFARGPQPDEDE